MLNLANALFCVWISGMIFLPILHVCCVYYLYVARVASKRVMDVVKDLHAGALCILATMRRINDNQRKLKYKRPAWLVSEY